MQCHTEQLVQEVKVQEVHLREGRVEEGEGVSDQRLVGWVLFKQHNQEMAYGLGGGGGGQREEVIFIKCIAWRVKSKYNF